MDEQLKKRLIGAAVLFVIVVAVIPELLTGPAPSEPLVHLQGNQQSVSIDLNSDRLKGSALQSLNKTPEEPAAVKADERPWGDQVKSWWKGLFTAHDAPAAVSTVTPPPAAATADGGSPPIEPIAPVEPGHVADSAQGVAEKPTEEATGGAAKNSAALVAGSVAVLTAKTLTEHSPAREGAPVAAADPNKDGAHDKLKEGSTKVAEVDTKGAHKPEAARATPDKPKAEGKHDEGVNGEAKIHGHDEKTVKPKDGVTKHAVDSDKSESKGPAKESTKGHEQNSSKSAADKPATGTSKDNGEKSKSHAEVSGREAKDKAADHGKEHVKKEAADSAKHAESKGTDAGKPADSTNRVAKEAAARDEEGGRKPDHFVIHLGSYSDKKQAQEIVAKLAKEGFRVKLITSHANNTTQYRVRLAPEIERAKAEADLKRLEKLGIEARISP